MASRIGLKQIRILVVALAGVFIFSHPLLSQYAPFSSQPWNDYITGAKVGTVDNLNQPSSEKKSDSNPVGYHDYTSEGTNLLSPGDVLTIEVDVVAANWNPNNSINTNLSFFLDGDGSQSFEEAERILDQVVVIPPSTSSAVRATVNLTIPAVSFVGMTRLRIAFGRDGIPTPSNTSKGEAEDYAIELTTASTNSQPPIPTITGPSQITMAGGSFNLVFDQPVSGLSASDINVAGGYVTSISGSSSNYTINVEPQGPSIAVQLPMNRVSGANGLMNEASNIVSAQVTQTNGQYCSPYNLTPYNNYITSVTFSGVSYGQPSNNLKGEQNNPAGYSTYTNTGFQSTSNSTVAISSTVISPNYNPNQSNTVFQRIWIDLNSDGAFSGAELLSETEITIPANVNGAGTAPVSTSLSVQIPSIGSDVNTTLRIVLSEDSYEGACSGNFDGEVEDYEVLILADPSLSYDMQPVDWRYIPPTIIQTTSSSFSVPYHYSSTQYLIGCNALSTSDTGTLRLTLDRSFLTDSINLDIGWVRESRVASPIATGTQPAAYAIALRGNFIQGFYPRDIATYLDSINTLSHPIENSTEGITVEIEVGQSNVLFKISGNVIRSEPRIQTGENLLPILFLQHLGTSNTVDAFVETSAPCNNLFTTERTVHPSYKSMDGQFTLETRGGQPPFELLWSDGLQTGSSRGGLGVGLHQYLATDATGRLKMGEIEILEGTEVDWIDAGTQVTVGENVFNATCTSGDRCRLKSDTFSMVEDGFIELRLKEDISPFNGNFEFNIGLEGFYEDGTAGYQLFKINAANGAKLVYGFQGNDQTSQPVGQPDDAKFPKAGDRFLIWYKGSKIELYRNDLLILEHDMGPGRRFPTPYVFLHLFRQGDLELDADIRTSFPVKTAAPSIAYVELEEQPGAWCYPVKEDVIPVQFRHRYAKTPSHQIEYTFLTNSGQPVSGYSGAIDYNIGINQATIPAPTYLNGPYLLRLNGVDYDESRYLRVKLSSTTSPPTQTVLSYE